jgi:hypothetical protein
MLNDYYVGIDPDTHTTALALIDTKNTVLAVDVVRADNLDDMVMAVSIIHGWLKVQFGNEFLRLTCVVEGQESYLGPGRHARVSDLLNLAYVAGACAGACYASPLVAKVLRPLPKEWKGTISKKQKQEHIARKLGWKWGERADYIMPATDSYVPDLPAHIKPADWKHIMDAIGLALWGCEKAI